MHDNNVVANSLLGILLDGIWTRGRDIAGEYF